MDLSVHPGVVYSVLMTSVSLAAVIDYRRRRIPNWLSFSGWYLGPLLHLIFAGTPGLSASLLGLVLVGVSVPAFMQRDVRPFLEKAPRGPAGAFVMGVAFAFGWTPCVGPILGGILTMAAEGSDPAAGAAAGAEPKPGCWSP